MADAAYAILTEDSRSCSGNFFIDEDVLRARGVSDFDRYAVDPTVPLAADFFLQDPDPWRADGGGERVRDRPLCCEEPSHL